MNFLQNLEMRSVIALVAVLGSISLALRDPNVYGIAAVSVLSTAVGGYYGLSQGHAPRTRTSKPKPTPRDPG